MSFISRPRWTRTVRLSSGGEISLAIEATVRDLSGRDSAFILGLIDALDRYQAQRDAGMQAPEQARPPGAGGPGHA